MVEPISELRRRVQEPVRAYNDVAGLVIGDRVSIHVTRLFLRLGLSPTVGTLAMLFCGLSGSVLAACGGWWSLAGFALVFLYYVFDCVDGEVARYHGREKLVWGFHDFMFHLYVKSAFFVALGIYAAGVTGRPWVFLLALSALLATLLTKSLYDAALILSCRYVLLRSHEERERFVRQLTEGFSPEHLAHEGVAAGVPAPPPKASALALAREALGNFDLGILAFLLAATMDLALQPFEVLGLPCDLKTALLMAYGLILPFDFLDRLWSYLRSDHFTADSRRVLQKADLFRLRR